MTLGNSLWHLAAPPALSIELEKRVLISCLVGTAVILHCLLLLSLLTSFSDYMLLWNSSRMLSSLIRAALFCIVSPYVGHYLCFPLLKDP